MSSIIFAIPLVIITILVMHLVLKIKNYGADSLGVLSLMYWLTTCITLWLLFFNIGTDLTLALWFYLIWKIVITIMTIFIIIVNIVEGLHKGTEVLYFLTTIITFIVIWFI